MKAPIPLCVFLLSFSSVVKAMESPSPTHADVRYGPHERNVLDFWQAKGDGPRPLLVYIHGGGWTKGDKSEGGPGTRTYLEKGISMASINYRFTSSAPLPAPVHDAARAIQFLRSQAREWNINQDRICLIGASAGACTSMWLLCHDDLADKDSKDPVSRESTRVSGVVAIIGQTSIDPPQIREWLGPNVLQHRMIHMAVGAPTMEAALESYDKHKDVYAEFSPYNHVTKDDPPLFMSYGGDMTLPCKSGGHGIHHPVFGLKMKEKADRVGMECHLVLGKGKISKSAKYTNAEAFLLDKLLGGH